MWVRVSNRVESSISTVSIAWSLSRIHALWSFKGHLVWIHHSKCSQSWMEIKQNTSPSPLSYWRSSLMSRSIFTKRSYRLCSSPYSLSSSWGWSKRSLSRRQGSSSMMKSISSNIVTRKISTTWTKWMSRTNSPSLTSPSTSLTNSKWRCLYTLSSSCSILWNSINLSCS